MTPDEARKLHAWARDIPTIKRRYMLEGGQRRAWKCTDCPWHAEAETADEALEILHTEAGPIAAPCPHPAVTDTQNFLPPLNFR